MWRAACSHFSATPEGLGMPRQFIFALLVTCLSDGMAATPAPEVSKFVVVSAPRVALRHVSVIDGTGAAPRTDQTVILVDGRIASIGPTTTTIVSADTEVHDYPGYSVLPGLVGMT